MVISEIMYFATNALGENPDFEVIQLENITGADVPLFDPAYPTNTWRLRDGVAFDFPTNTSPAAGARLLLVGFSPTDPELLDTFRLQHGVAGTVPIFAPWAGRLDNNGDSLELYAPSSHHAPPHLKPTNNHTTNPSAPHPTSRNEEPEESRTSPPHLMQITPHGRRETRNLATRCFPPPRPRQFRQPMKASGGSCPRRHAPRRPPFRQHRTPPRLGCTRPGTRGERAAGGEKTLDRQKCLLDPATGGGRLGGRLLVI